MFCVVGVWCYLLPAPRVTPPDECVGADGRLMCGAPAERVLPPIADGRLGDAGREGAVMLLFGVECDGDTDIDGRVLPGFGRFSPPRLPCPALLPGLGRMPGFGVPG